MDDRLLDTAVARAIHRALLTAARHVFPGGPSRWPAGSCAAAGERPAGSATSVFQLATWRSTVATAGPAALECRVAAAAAAPCAGAGSAAMASAAAAAGPAQRPACKASTGGRSGCRCCTAASKSVTHGVWRRSAAGGSAPLQPGCRPSPAEPAARLDSWPRRRVCCHGDALRRGACSNTAVCECCPSTCSRQPEALPLAACRSFHCAARCQPTAGSARCHTCRCCANWQRPAGAGAGLHNSHGSGGRRHRGHIPGHGRR